MSSDVNIFLPEQVNLYGCVIGDETKIGTFVEIQKNAIILDVLVFKKNGGDKVSLYGTMLTDCFYSTKIISLILRVILIKYYKSSR
jgi:hypothetical protein